MNLDTQKHTKRIKNHEPWPFELVKVNYWFQHVRDPLRWLPAAKNAKIISVLAFELQNLFDFKKRDNASSILWYCFLNQIMKKKWNAVFLNKDMHSDLPTDLLTD